METIFNKFQTCLYFYLHLNFFTTFAKDLRIHEVIRQLIQTKYSESKKYSHKEI